MERRAAHAKCRQNTQHEYFIRTSFCMKVKGEQIQAQGVEIKRVEVLLSPLIWPHIESTFGRGRPDA